MKKTFSLLLLIVFLAFSYSCVKLGATSEKRDQEDQKQLFNQKQLAIASIRRGNYRQAIEDIAIAEKINAQDPEIYVIKGAIYYGLKEYRIAESNYLQALNVDNSYTKARYNLCGLYLVQNRLDEAIKQCSIAGSDILYEAKPSVFTNLGKAYFKKGQIEKAQKYYNKALEINPAYVYTRNELGKLYLSISRENDAVHEFKQAVRGLPEYEEAHFNLGITYLKLGERLLACQQFDKVVSMSPNSKLGIDSAKYLGTICVKERKN